MIVVVDTVARNAREMAMERTVNIVSGVGRVTIATARVQTKTRTQQNTNKIR